MMYRSRMLVLSIIDNMLLLVSWIGSFILINAGISPLSLPFADYVFAGLFIIMGYLFLTYSKSYKTLWKYSGVQELIKVVQSITLSSIIYAALVTLLSNDRFPITMYIVLWITSILLLSSFRIGFMIMKERRSVLKARKKRALIVGAGTAGTLIAKQLLLQDIADLSPIGFIDDDRKKQNFEIHGIPVLGTREDIPRIVSMYGITDIVVAIPSAPNNEINSIAAICKQTTANVKIMPRMKDVILGRILDNKIREIDVKDLLGREMINESMINAESYIKNNVVLVTGAGGSIGGELVNQVAQCSPHSIILLGHGENSIHNIEAIMRERYPALTVHSIIADIQNAKEVEDVFRRYSPRIVFHAAAHKHVPLMENNPSAAVRNNVFGTLNVVEGAISTGVKRFVFISTDKAVSPVNVMGMTKRIAEMIIQSKSKSSSTTFSIVRFGNVLESRGSVIPIFKKQIAALGPVTVTHPDMVRYFMTIPEAVHLVLQAGALSNGGEIFVLDMGKPVKIVDLAKALVRFAGYEPDQEIKIIYTGMRPGEKLSESLFYDKEQILPSKHPRIFIASPSPIDFVELQADIKKLEAAVLQDPVQLKDLLGTILQKHSLAIDERGDAM